MSASGVRRGIGSVRLLVNLAGEHGLSPKSCLEGTDMSVEEVAERLGYAESSSFVHAFKRWKDVSPTDYRDRRRAGIP